MRRACGIRAHASRPCAARSWPSRTGGPSTRARLQPFRLVGPVGPVLVGREPQVASRLAADGGLVTADPQRDLAHAEPLAVPQLVDPDPLLGRQVGIHFRHGRSTFSS